MKELYLEKSKPCEFEGCTATARLYGEWINVAEGAELDSGADIFHPDRFKHFWRCDDGHREPATRADRKGGER